MKLSICFPKWLNHFTLPKQVMRVLAPHLTNTLCGCLAAQSCLTLCGPWTVTHQAFLSMRLSRQEYWSGLPFPTLGYLPYPGIESESLESPSLQVDSSPMCHLGKTTALTIWTFVNKVRSLLFNMPSRFVIAFLPRSNHLLISWLQSLSGEIFGAQEKKICHCIHLFPIYLP